MLLIDVNYNLKVIFHKNAESLEMKNGKLTQTIAKRSNETFLYK